MVNPIFVDQLLGVVTGNLTSVRAIDCAFKVCRVRSKTAKGLYIIGTTVYCVSAACGVLPFINKVGPLTTKNMIVCSVGLNAEHLADVIASNPF